MKNKFGFLKIVFLLAFSLCLSPVNVSLAHEQASPKDEKITLEITSPSVIVEKYKTPIFLSITTKDNGYALGGLSVYAYIENKDSQIIARDLKIDQKGKDYMFEFDFPEAGNYKIHIMAKNDFGKDKTSLEKDIVVSVAPKSAGTFSKEGLAFYICSIIGLIILILGIIKKKYKLGIIWFLILLALGGLIYSLIFTEKQNPSNGIVTCPKSDGICVWTAHIHAYMPINICGEYFRLPTEVGALNMPHTHEEKNLAHWHDQLPYDMDTKSVKNVEHLLVKSFFDEIKIPFSEDRIANKKNGDLCPNGKPSTFRAFLNGLEKKDFPNYLWRDHDVIYFEFSDRKTSEIEKELKDNPISFPILGRG